jgi:hypothetical protein
VKVDVSSDSIRRLNIGLFIYILKMLYLWKRYSLTFKEIEISLRAL